MTSAHTHTRTLHSFIAQLSDQTGRDGAQLPFSHARVSLVSFLGALSSHVVSLSVGVRFGVGETMH